ncbi:bifunctional 2-polyprenyl-6-hydroxyphenol methylase/3-demethylubiquinol 3-O-methyltransferase UbiG [Herbaspirillum sp. YR522]|uniref:class I SAM-dependent methyltransferase n=1 Tax=Herbaspirillum sp. YR522 TaxID=1144342 RepID=UPI00026FAB9A|nr:class I SAM-dependent methyltransferase [Herbaspirillum sp. YR522]EJM95859.1 methyltransferase family protein [Herbaspirillum sp. YR522]
MHAFSRILSCCKPDAAPEQHPLEPTDRAQPASSAPGGMGVVIRNTAHIETATPGLEAFYPIIERTQPAGQARRAIDLGSGGGRDSKFLAARGWDVTAADTEKDAAGPLANHARIKFVLGSLDAVAAEPGSIALINCQRVTPFMSLEQLRAMLARASHILSPTGQLAISFFGPSHSWTLEPEHKDKLFYDIEAIETELARCDLKLVAHPNETKGPQRAANGKKVECWHEIRVVAARDVPVREPALAARLRAGMDTQESPQGPSAGR